MEVALLGSLGPPAITANKCNPWRRVLLDGYDHPIRLLGHVKLILWNPHQLSVTAGGVIDHNTALTISTHETGRGNLAEWMALNPARSSAQNHNGILFLLFQFSPSLSAM